MATRQTSELIERLRVSKRGRWLVAAATLAAAAAAVVLVLPIRPVYRTVAVVGSDPGAQSANERLDFAADVRASVEQNSVLEAVSEELGVPVARLRQGLSMVRIGDSNLIRLIYESPDPDAELATQVVALAPEKALEFLKRGEMDSAQSLVDSVQEDLAAARADLAESTRAIDAAVQANGYVPPDVTVASLQGQLSELQTIVATRPPGDEERDRAASTIGELEAQLAPAIEAAAAYQVLVSARDDALARRRDLETALSSANDVLRNVSSQPSIEVQSVAVKRSPVRSALVQVLGVTAIALVGSLLVVSAWERRGKRPTGRHGVDVLEVGAASNGRPPDLDERTDDERVASRRGDDTPGTTPVADHLRAGR